jgi:hypothetical protein
MEIGLIHDDLSETIRELHEVLDWMINIKKEVAEKDKKILELEEKLRKYENGS